MIRAYKKLHTFLIGFLFIFLFFSCNKKEEIPADIIPTDKMATVLKDVHLSEALITNKRYNRDTLPVVVSTFYCDIFEKHEITEEDFQKSLDYYTTHLDEMKKVYQKVVAELNKEE